jgi:hypothetical protein
MKRKQGEAVREQDARVTEVLATSASRYIQRDGRTPVGETGVNDASTTVMVNGQTQAAAERGADQMKKIIDIEHNQGVSGPNSSSTTTYQTHDREDALGSKSQDVDPDFSGSGTSLPVPETQSSRTLSILSKADLKERIKTEKEALPKWIKSQTEVEKSLEKWKSETPLLIGRDGKKYYDCGRKKDGKRKQRERLSEEEKRTYQKRINENFRASLGDDSRWWYQMFGECYIHGMMDGEAMAHQNNEGIPTTVFEIR